MDFAFKTILRSFLTLTLETDITVIVLGVLLDIVSAIVAATVWLNTDVYIEVEIIVEVHVDMDIDVIVVVAVTVVIGVPGRQAVASPLANSFPYTGGRRRIANLSKDESTHILDNVTTPNTEQSRLLHDKIWELMVFS